MLNTNANVKRRILNLITKFTILLNKVSITNIQIELLDQSERN